MPSHQKRNLENTYHGVGNEDWWVQQCCRAQTRRDREVGRWSSWHWIISSSYCAERHAELWYPESSSCLHSLSKAAARTGLLAKLWGHRQQLFVLLKSGLGNLGAWWKHSGLEVPHQGFWWICILPLLHRYMAFHLSLGCSTWWVKNSYISVLVVNILANY